MPALETPILPALGRRREALAAIHRYDEAGAILGAEAAEIARSSIDSK
jgi:hypothetical protein